MPCRGCRSTVISTTCSCSSSTRWPPSAPTRPPVDGAPAAHRRPLFAGARRRAICSTGSPTAACRGRRVPKSGCWPASTRARAHAADGVSTAVSVPLAADLKRLGDLYRQQGREQPGPAMFRGEHAHCASACSASDHADTRASRASLAGLLRRQRQAARRQIPVRTAGRRLPAPARRRPSRNAGRARRPGRHPGRAARIHAGAGLARRHHRRLGAAVRRPTMR